MDYEQASSDARQLLMQGMLELETKALNYLLVANGAGLAGCLAALKDYAAVPQLRGLGALVIIFSTGLIFGTVGFVLFQSANFEMMRTVLTRDSETKLAANRMALTSVAMKFSGGCFILALIIIAGKLYPL